MRFINILLAILFAVVMSACNTMQGIGKDIKRGGETLEKAAR